MKSLDTKYGYVERFVVLFNQSISFRSQNVTKYYFLLFNISIYMILEQSKFIYLGEAVIPLY